MTYINFTQVPFRCVLGMPSNSVIKAEFKKSVYAKSIYFRKKICSPAGFELECKSVAIPIELSVLWSFDEMLLEFSPLLCLQAAAERKLITTLTHGDKLEVGG